MNAMYTFLHAALPTFDFRYRNHTKESDDTRRYRHR